MGGNLGGGSKATLFRIFDEADETRINTDAQRAVASKMGMSGSSLGDTIEVKPSESGLSADEILRISFGQKK